MATLVATFTDPRDAALAAASLQASGFRGVTVGSSEPDPSSFLGLGESVESFKNRIILGSTIGGAATGAAALGFLGFVSMGFTEIRNMAMLEQLPGVIIWRSAGLSRGWCWVWWRACWWGLSPRAFWPMPPSAPLPKVRGCRVHRCSCRYSTWSPKRPPARCSRMSVPSRSPGGADLSVPASYACGPG